jgi:transporter family-2 protein
MNILYMTFISILAGAAIAIQSSMSGQFSNLTRSPILASFVIYFTCSVLVGGYLLFSKGRIPSVDILKSIPLHLWFVGALLSIFALTIVYWQMPKIGVAKVMTGVLAGQLIISTTAAHFGWFGLPVTTLTATRIIGVMLMGTGLFFINGSSN